MASGSTSKALTTSAERHGVEGAVLRLAVVGEIDLASKDVFEDTLADAVTAPAVTDVVVDLAGVEFCDSNGIKALVRAWRAAAERGVSVRISNPQRHVRRVLEVAGVLDLLTAR